MEKGEDIKTGHMNNKINKTGYLKGSQTEKNNYNIIPGGDITMKNVEKSLLAIKLGKDGKPIGMEFMDPNKEYEFDDTYAVLEVPKYQFGGAPMFPIDQNLLPPPVDASLQGRPQTLNDLYNNVNFSGNQANTIELTPEQLNDDSPITEGPFPQLNAYKGQSVSEIEAEGIQLQDNAKPIADVTGIDTNLQNVSSNEELEGIDPGEFNQREFEQIQSDRNSIKLFKSLNAASYTRRARQIEKTNLYNEKTTNLTFFMCYFPALFSRVFYGFSKKHET